MRCRTPLVVLCLIAALSCAPPEPTPVRLMYVANEGFLMQAGDSKILIDAMFNDETINYAHVPDRGTLASLEGAEPPFDDVDLILVTHSHRDHFAPEPVLRHLAANPKGVLLAPTQAIEMLHESKDILAEIGSRIREVSLELHQATEIIVGDIRIEAHRLRHSPFMVKEPDSGESYNRHEDVENILYLVDAGGVKLFHIGDALLSNNLDYLGTDSFPSRELDIAFLEFFDWSEETKELLGSRLDADHVVFMHLPREKEQIEKYARHLQANFSNAVVFREPGEIRELPPVQ